MGCKEVSRSGVFVCETFQDLVLLKIEWGSVWIKASLLTVATNYCVLK